ncbi:MAG TPA: LemA family protein [Patescibacteria group bacterium]|nr:LemA family protein [Patescibacteria group bacterium]
MNVAYLIIGLVVLAAIWLVSVYNFFATAKTRVNASVQEIGNQLKRQADLIPNLVSSAKGYLKHEKGIFEMLTNARKQIAGAMSSGNVDKMAKASAQLSAVLPKLSVAVEDNPELKGNTVVTDLMDDLRDTADKIMYARRLMIDLTADYNVKLVTFPTSVIAGMFGFTALRGLETSEADTKTPKVDL